MHTLDFTDVDLYPKRYWFVRDELVIRSLIVENIATQRDVLIAKKDKLMLGDAIEVSFIFGHNASQKEEDGELWVDYAVNGLFKVTKIDMFGDNELELTVKQIKRN
jgi:hypothetical protein